MNDAETAWREWLDSQPRTFADYDHARKAGFMAGYRRALEDAADHALAVDKDGEAAASDAIGLWDSAHASLTDLLMNHDAAEDLSGWLRDRAASVAGDPA